MSGSESRKLVLANQKGYAYPEGRGKGTIEPVAVGGGDEWRAVYGKIRKESRAEKIGNPKTKTFDKPETGKTMAGKDSQGSLTERDRSIAREMEGVAEAKKKSMWRGVWEKLMRKPRKR